MVSAFFIYLDKYFHTKSFANGKYVYICSPLINGFVAQLDRASHYGWEGLGFESLQDHQSVSGNWSAFFMPLNLFLDTLFLLTDEKTAATIICSSYVQEQVIS